jgi:hypothetical protein
VDSHDEERQENRENSQVKASKAGGGGAKEVVRGRQRGRCRVSPGVHRKPQGHQNL